MHLPEEQYPVFLEGIEQLGGKIVVAKKPVLVDPVDLSPHPVAEHFDGQ